MHRIEPAGANLEGLRAELEGIDRTICLLLAERIRTARRAIDARRRERGGASDLKQEQRVLRRAHTWAKALGLPEPVVDRLFRGLMAEGKRPGRPETTPVVTVFLAGPAPSHGSEPESLLLAPSVSRPLPAAALLADLR